MLVFDQVFWPSMVGWANCMAKPSQALKPRQAPELARLSSLTASVRFFAPSLPSALCT